MKPSPWLLDREEQDRAERRLARESQELIDENDAIRRCVAIEGEGPFYTWFENPMIANVPRAMRIQFIENRIAKHERSVAKE